MPPSTSEAPAKRKGAANKKQEKRLASMELLLEAALRLFVSQGYRSTNLEQIASAAKLTKGAVYFYFRSKEAVLVALLRRVSGYVIDDGGVIAGSAGPTATDRLVAYLHHQAGLGITRRDEVLLLILMSLEFKERDSEVQALIRDLYRRQCAILEKLVAAGQASGEFRSDVRPKELAAIIQAMHDGTFLEWFRRSSTLRGTELVRALRVVVLGGVTANGGRGRRAAGRSA